MTAALPDLRQRAAAVSVLAAVQLLVLAAVTEFAQAAACLAVGHASSLALAAGAAAAIFVAVAYARRAGARGAVIATAISALAALASPLLARTYDVSWDGQAYHQLAIQQLAGGWSPFGTALPGSDLSNAYFVNHYAKGAWLRAAAVYLLGGDIEAAKGWTFALAAAAGLAALGALLRARGIRGWAAIAAAALATANPVVTTQILTNYVDGQLASLLTATAALAAVVALRGGRVAIVGLAACASLAPGLKFTGFVYASLFAAGAVAAAWRWDRAAARRVALACAGGLAVGTLFVGFNPYVTNWRSRGHPFFPLAGPGAIDIITGHAGPVFMSRSRFEKVALSVLAASQNEQNVEPTLKWPFTLVRDETTPFRWPDVRLGGFGPFFSGALVLSLAALLAARRTDRRASALAAGMAAALLATALVNPHAWWARYAPQLWLFPIVLALGAATRAGGRAAAVLAAAALVTTAADAGIVAVNAINRGLKRSAVLEAQLASLAREPLPVPVRFRFESHRARLRDAGVRFVEADPLPCARPEKLESTNTEFCRTAGVPRPAGP